MTDCGHDVSSYDRALCFLLTRKSAPSYKRLVTLRSRRFSSRLLRFDPRIQSPAVTTSIGRPRRRLNATGTTAERNATPWVEGMERAFISLLGLRRWRQIRGITFWLELLVFCHSFPALLRSLLLGAPGTPVDLPPPERGGG